MSIHPNVILLLVIKPDNLSRKTMRLVLEATNTKEGNDIKIGDYEYHYKIAENEYDIESQISAEEGDLLIFDLVTYGYGDKISWDEIEEQKNTLEEWAKDICNRFQCSYKIYVTANYW